MTMAGGLRYATGRDMPPGMQQLAADKLVQTLRSAVAMAVTATIPEEMPERMTNGDRLRGLSDEELVEGLHELVLMMWERNEDISSLWCDLKGDCVGPKGEELECSLQRHKACILRWVRSPVKEVSNGTD